MAPEYIKKGFVLDDERLKNPDQPFDYFEEYYKYHSKRLSSSTQLMSDFDKAVKQIEASKKKEDVEK